jgi:bla regulator protein blaR1
VAGEVSTPNASDAGSSTHQDIALDTKTLDAYVGTYQLRAAGIMSITREGSSLFAQLTGQPRIQIYPQSPSEFFYEVVDARISFVSDPPGSVSSLVLHQNGHDVSMPRVDASVANQYAVNLAAKIQSQTAAPGSEAALRRTIAGILSGQPNYAEMTPELAAVTRQQLPKLEALVQGFGAVQSVEFRGVGQAGWDSYEVKQDGGSTVWRISLDSSGIIDGALVTLAP